MEGQVVQMQDIFTFNRHPPPTPTARLHGEFPGHGPLRPPLH